MMAGYFDGRGLIILYGMVFFLFFWPWNSGGARVVGLRGDAPVVSY